MEIIQEYSLYIIATLSFLSLIFLIWIIRLEMRMHKLLRGKNASTLEDTIVHVGKEVERLESSRQLIEEHLVNVEGRLKKAILGVHTLRFNPFQGNGSGGNQSFATAFLNEEGNGVVISSIHARERVSVYAKPLSSYSSSFELTKEEKDSIKEARSKQKSS